MHSRLARVALVALGLFASLAVLQLLRNAGDFWTYYVENPEMLRDVRVLESVAGSIRAPPLAHDFDGDGVADEFSVEYFHMEPILGHGTSALLHLRSGADGTELLVYPIDNPFTPVTWAGDIDGNGTDDLRAGGRSLLHAR